MHVNLSVVNAFDTYFYVIEHLDNRMRVAHTPIMKTENTPLLEARIASGITQTDLAAMLGVNQGYLSRVERGMNSPGPELATKIVAQFKGAIDEMMLFYPERYMLPKTKKRSKRK